MKLREIAWILPVLAAVALSGCGDAKQKTEAAGPPTEEIQALFAGMPHEMASPTNPITEEKVTLGRMLYYDGRMSASGEISCNSCHVLTEYGVDGEPTSPGFDGTRGARNSPTVYNAALHIAQFWDGREPDVEAQAKGPILNPVEHGMSAADDVAAVIKGIPGYAPLFAAAFPGEEDPITFDNIAKAIGAFERKLVTRGRWDRWLDGDGEALTAQERRGVETFIALDCVSCHTGPNLGGDDYQEMGMAEAYETEDLGRFDATGLEEDKGVFKVPALRNIAETAPYLHDGSVATLADVVDVMAVHQLGETLTPEQRADLAAFLKALTGEIPAAYVAEPELPM